jgi:hypothetical protein
MGGADWLSVAFLVSMGCCWLLFMAALVFGRRR